MNFIFILLFILIELSEHSSKKPMLTSVAAAADEIDCNTLFVLGKNWNELFVNESVPSMNGSAKNVYTQFPTLFKYEADNEDRIWLCDNSIIERKHYKTYIFRLDDILHLNLHLGNNGNSKLKHFKLPEFMLIKIRATKLKQH